MWKTRGLVWRAVEGLKQLEIQFKFRLELRNTVLERNLGSFINMVIGGPTHYSKTNLILIKI